MKEFIFFEEIPKTEIKLRTAAKLISNNRILHPCRYGGQCITMMDETIRVTGRKFPTQSHTEVHLLTSLLLCRL